MALTGLEVVYFLITVLPYKEYGIRTYHLVDFGVRKISGMFIHKCSQDNQQ